MIVIARSYGQLGNRLFLYAHFIAAAREHGVQLANPCFAEYASLFPATAGDLWCRFPRQPIETPPPSLNRRRSLAKTVYLTAKSLSLMGASRYPFQVLRITGDRECDLAGEEFARAAQGDRHLLALGWLFRSESLLRQHADVVREHLEIAPRHRDRVDQRLAEARRDSDVVVGVHIRHGDYATFMGGQFYYPVNKYAAMMRNITEQLAGRRVAFLVCSDATIDRGEFGDLQVHFGPGHLVEDMYALAEADLLIGPPSTYTTWASFYGNVPLFVMRNADDPIEITIPVSSCENHAVWQPAILGA